MWGSNQTQGDTLIGMRKFLHDTERQSWMCGSERFVKGVLALCKIVATAEHCRNMACVLQCKAVIREGSGQRLQCDPAFVTKALGAVPDWPHAVEIYAGYFVTVDGDVFVRGESAQWFRFPVRLAGVITLLSEHCNPSMRRVLRSTALRFCSPGLPVRGNQTLLCA